MNWIMATTNILPAVHKPKICKYKYCNKEVIGRGHKKFCSSTCRTYHSHGDTIIPGVLERNRIENAPYSNIYLTSCIISGVNFFNRKPITIPLHYAHPQYREQYRKAIASERATHLHLSQAEHIDIQCKECGEDFYATSKRVFCSRKCMNRHFNRIARHKQRALIRTVKIDNVNPLIVFERDSWTCKICGIHTPRELSGKHRNNSPELDHIIPLSKGGEHSYLNTQLLCKECNFNKSDKILGINPILG
jgi:endogenous inhibitor of DNA gyrase (YacG/DUF329 family)